MDDIKEILTGLAGDFGQFRAKNDALTRGLAQRLDEIESSMEGLSTGGTLGRPGRHKPAHQVLFTDSGDKCLLLPRETKISDVLDLASQDKCPIDYSRWASALVLGERCGDSEAIAYLKEQKSLSTTTSGVPVPSTVLAEWIDNLRAQSVVFRAGAQTLTMPTKVVSAAAIVGDPAVGWHAEGGSISAGDPSLVIRSLTAQTLVGRTQISFEASQDVVDIGRQLGRVYTQAMAAELDRVALGGSGSGEPAGISVTSGRATIAAVGTPTDYSDLVAGVGLLLANNLSEDDVTAIVYSPSLWTQYGNLKTGLTNDNTPLGFPDAIGKIPRFVTSNTPGYASSPQSETIIVGDFRDLVIGIRMEAAVRVLDTTTSYASNLLLEVIGVMRADVMVRRPKSFCTLEGVTSA